MQVPSEGHIFFIRIMEYTGRCSREKKCGFLICFKFSSFFFLALIDFNDAMSQNSYPYLFESGRRSFSSNSQKKANEQTKGQCACLFIS